MQRLLALVLLSAGTLVSAQNDKKNGTATRFFGAPGVGGGGLPFGQGGFGPVGVSPPIGLGPFPPGGIVGPGIVGPGIAGPGIVGPGIVGPGINPQQPFISPLRPDCKFFKRDAFGRWVCDVDQKVYNCPPLRPECPRLTIPGAPPQQCFNDNDCYLNDKCCPDICFDHLICKGPE